MDGALEAPVAVLLMAYGAARTLGDIPAYLADIRGGRSPEPDLIEQVTNRYRAMGGRSPLQEITERQARSLEDWLDEEVGAARFKVFVGMRHSPPTIREAVRRLGQGGFARAVAIALTPYDSGLSVGAYLKALEEARAAEGAGFEVLPVRSWCREPLFIDCWAQRIGQARARLPEPLRPGARVLFTAHSLPKARLSAGDPYPAELEATARGVADKAGLKDWGLAYQSRGRVAGEWLGPEAGEALERFKRDGARAVVLAPFGFVSDHMETLYDVDVLYRGVAQGMGLAFERAASPNDDPLLVGALASAVLSRLHEARP